MFAATRSGSRGYFRDFTSSRDRGRRRALLRAAAGCFTQALVESIESRLLLSTFVVTNTSDAGAGSLRAAIASANSSAGADTITFDPSVFSSATPRTISLSTGQMILSDTTGQTTIQGPGADVLTIDAKHLSRVFQINGGVSVNLQSMKLINGSGNGGGGGLIANSGMLSVSDSTLNSGTFFGICDGAVIASTATGTGTASLTLTNCTLSGSTVTGIGNGGAIFNSATSATASATATLTGCTLSGNGTQVSIGNGGAIYNVSSVGGNATVNLTNCTLSNNAAGAFGNNAGGAIYNTASGTGGKATVTLDGCTVSGNSAPGNGGAIVNTASSPATATVTLTNCTLSNNSAASTGIGDGGAICNGGITGIGGITNVTLNGCTLNGNSAGKSGIGHGGAIFNSSGTGTAASATLTNCTLTANIGSFGGGGIYNVVSGGGSANVIAANCTISGNSTTFSGGGIDNVSGATTLTNTIVAGNTGGSGRDLAGAFVAANSTHNLIGVIDNNSSGIINGVNGNIGGTAASPLNAKLAPLANYGGATSAFALLPGSPAIDAAATDANVTTDQRGVSRSFGSAPDIGAFESRGFTLSVVSGDGQSALVTTPFAAPLVVSLSSAFGEPVTGGVVSFAAPASGASATLSQTTVTVSAGGTASVTATANLKDGTYQVGASVPHVAPTTFTLTNVPPQEPNPLVVTTLKDEWDNDGKVSLREATIYAAYHAGPDTITFDPSLFIAAATPQKITLSLGQMEVSDAAGLTTIVGPGANVLTIDANHSNRVFQVDAGASLDISGMTFANGVAPLQNLPIGQFRCGGAILSFGSLKASDCEFSGNTAASFGGAIYSYASSAPPAVFHLTGCVFDGNTSGTEGGGAYVGAASTSAVDLDVSGSTFAANQATSGAALDIAASGGARIDADVVDSTFAGNIGSQYAGGINAFASHDGASVTLDLERSKFTSNSASRGGGLYVEADFKGASATLTMSDCELTDNTATLFGGGVAIDAASGMTTTVIDSSTFSGNTTGPTGSGGAIYQVAGSINGDGTGNTTLTVNDTVIEDGASNYGGGIFASGAAVTTLSDCTIRGNTAGAYGGGIYQETSEGVAQLQITGCEIDSNTGFYGGGVYNEAFSFSTYVGTANVSVSDSVLSNNKSRYGGAIFDFAFETKSTTQVSLTNCTLGGNSSAFDDQGNVGFGGAIGVRSLEGSNADVTLTNCTISANSSEASGGGIYTEVTDAVVTVTLDNSLVAGNNAPVDAGPDIAGRYDSSGQNNLIGVLDGASTGIVAGINGNLAGTAASPLDPHLGPLADNGGATKTMALLPGSPATDAGSNALASDLTNDQRGSGFARVVHGTVDIGAFEVQDTPPTESDLSLSTDEDQPLALTANVFGAGFSDLDGDMLSRIRIESLPTHGTLALGGVGVAAGQVIDAADLASLTYTGDSNYSGADDFTFRVADDYFFADAAAQAAINVIPVADAPNLSAANVSGVEATWIGLNIAALLNDTDGSESLSVAIYGVPANAMLSAGTRDASGVWKVDPADLAGLKLKAPDDATLSLTVTATARENANGDTASTSVPFTVTVVNAPPAVRIVQSPAQTLYPQQPMSITFVAGDVGLNDALSATIDWGDGTTTPVGSARGVVTLGHTYKLSGQHTIKVTVTDDDGGSATATTLVNVFTPAAALNDLLGDVQSLQLQQGVASSLIDKLQSAAQSLALGTTSGNAATAAALDDFIQTTNKWYAKAKLTSAGRDQLVQEAQWLKLAVLA